MVAGARTSSQPYCASHKPIEETVMLKIFKDFAQDESGATAIEYGLIAALISVAAIAAMTSVGGELTNIFNFISGKLSGAQTG